MEKTISIDDKLVRFRATAALPRLYRIKFHRDMIQDMGTLKTAFSKAVTEEEQFSAMDLEIFENCAYLMALHACPDIGSVEEWFEQFETFSVYKVLPEVLDLWLLNESTQAESKKKLNELTES